MLNKNNIFSIRTTMGSGPSIFSKEYNDQLKQRNTQKTIDEMASKRGIRIPGPNEDLTEIPDFDNAGDAAIYASRLSKKQIKQVKDIPFRIAGRRQLSLTQRNELSPLSHDSLTTLGSSNAIQEVIKIAKAGGDGAELLIGANRGGKIAPSPPMIGGQTRKRGGF
jgi:hypothetical protein